MVKFDSTMRVTVTFTKNFGSFKKGMSTKVGLVLAAEWVRTKVATLSKESRAYVEERGLKEMFARQSGK